VVPHILKGSVVITLFVFGPVKSPSLFLDALISFLLLLSAVFKKNLYS